MIKKAALPAGFATALAFLPDALAKKLLLILGVMIAVPTTTAGFVGAVMISRAQNLAEMDRGSDGKGLDPSFLSGGPMDISERLDKAVGRRRAALAEIQDDPAAAAKRLDTVRKLLVEDRVIHARLKPEKLRSDVNADVRLTRQIVEIDAMHERLADFVSMAESSRHAAAP